MTSLQLKTCRLACIGRTSRCSRCPIPIRHPTHRASVTPPANTCPVCAKTPCYGVLGHFWGRFRWSCKTARHAEPRTLAARLRLLWHDFALHALLHRGSERCQDCGRAFDLWRATDAEWQRVMGGPYGVLCLRCFRQRGGTGRPGLGASCSGPGCPCNAFVEAGVRHG